MVSTPIQTDFAQVTDASLARHQQLIRQSEKLVGQTFYGTLLKQMQDSPFKVDKLSGGRGEQAFFPLMAQHLVDRMSRGAGGKLSRNMARQMEGRDKFKIHEEYLKTHPASAATKAVQKPGSVYPASALPKLLSNMPRVEIETTGGVYA